jgi:hypothetical protein
MKNILECVDLTLILYFFCLIIISMLEIISIAKVPILFSAIVDKI